MIVAILIVILVGLSFITTNSTNKVCWAISLCIFGVCILMFTGVFYICKFSYYDSKFRFDYYMYLALSGIKISMTSLSWLSSIGTAFILSSFLILVFFLTYRRHWWLYLLPIPILFFIVTSTPIFCYNAYILIHSAESPERSEFLKNFFELIKNINLNIFLAYMCIPLITLIVYAKKTKIFFLKHDALISLVCMGFIDVFLLYVFIFGIFRDIMFHNIELLRFPTLMGIDKFSFYRPAFLLFLISILVFFTTFYKPFHSLGVISEKQLMKNNKQFGKNLRMMLHAEKNTIFSINLLAKQGLETGENITKKLEDIVEITSQSMANLSRTLDLFRDSKMSFENYDLIKCVDSALYKVFTSDLNVNVKTSYNKCDSLYISMDKSHIHEVFLNIFHNSLEALENCKNNPEIYVNIISEEGFAIIDVTDNGCGISKKNIRKIFSPLFSTKSNSTNWGVGLHYVSKILHLHNGYIRVSSEPEIRTTFQIIIPLATKLKRRQIWKK